MEIGDIVKKKDGSYLRSGSLAYGGAVVVSLEPFILVSEHSDMKWQSTVNKDDFLVYGKAPQDMLDKCMTRIK